jgi:cytochrome c oxidase subunit 2
MEFGWTAGAFLVVLAMFFAGLTGFTFLRRVPPGSLEVKVIARQWSWLFQYGNGRTSGELVVPQGRPVALSLVSQDVIHGFFVPAFRIKQDVVPGMTTRAWFQADAAGSFDILCSSYCGMQHSKMLSRVVAVPEDVFRKWYAGESVEIPGVTAAADRPRGAQLLKEKGCLDCHSLDGSKAIGPTLQGIFGRSETVIVGGKKKSIIEDEGYVVESILEPSAKIVAGFKDMMPSQKGKISDGELREIVEFLRTLK